VTVRLTRVRDLARTTVIPSSGQRISTVNDDCIGTNWLTLGQGLVPRAVTTDGRGTGRADLFRNLAAIPLGTELDIHFRVIDSTTSAVVLASACYQFKVSQ
jgi:hypothetical protein